MSRFGWWLRTLRAQHEIAIGFKVTLAWRQYGFTGHPRPRGIEIVAQCGWGVALSLWFGKGAFNWPRGCDDSRAVHQWRSCGGYGAFGPPHPWQQYADPTAPRSSPST